MKRFIQWWLRGTGIGGNIKFYSSMIILAIVLIANAVNTENNGSSVEEGSADNHGYTYYDEYQEDCYEEPIYDYDSYGNYTIVYEEECY